MEYPSIAHNTEKATGTIAVGVVVCATAVLLGITPAGAQDAATLRAMAKSRTDSLKTVVVPQQPNLRRFVVNQQALQVLGKALFWDQQVGSDGQACASCHYHAGADNRSKNQLDPGLRNQTPGVNTGAFNDPTGFGPNTNNFGPNYQLTADDFPFHKIVDPNVNPELAGNPSLVLSDTNDIASSQGVFNAAFTAIKIPTDTGTPSATSGPGAIFNVGGVLVRNVEPRNTPTVINTVLNHRNFWDSRARNEFNGTNPIGTLD